MANEVTLRAQTRNTTGSSANRKLKNAGAVPAVMYGHGNPEILQVSAHELGIVLDHAVGEHFLVALEVEGEKGARHAILQDVQHHPVTGRVQHVDFMRVMTDEVISSTVPLESVGEPRGVKSGGGILEQSLHELEIECLPKDLPELIKVDVSGLGIGDSITVEDLELPPGVTALDDAELQVFVVAEPNVAVEETVEETAAPTEVLKEKPAKPSAEGSKA